VKARGRPRTQVVVALWPGYIVARVEFAANGCWLWQRSKLATGYGKVPRETGHVFAHRLSFEVFNGPIPRGLCVLHRCDTPACVNPDHLFLGTQMDNVRDARAKGRFANVGGRHASWLDPKARMHRAAEIRQRRSAGDTVRSLAKTFGLSEVHVSRICSGRACKAVSTEAS
jgi:hypothetical protein